MPPKELPSTGPPPDDEPTPQQAARALRELAARRHQALRFRSPRWPWWLGGAVFPAEGFADDVFPRAAGVINLCVIGVLLALALSVRYRPVGAALGYRASVRGRPPAGVSVVTVGGIVAIIAVEFSLHRVTDQIHSHWSHTIVGVIVGPLLALGMPWAIEQAYRQHGEMGRNGD
ncbi:hypothetical protein AB0M46_38180 [Dactylosporangium sp. NPDC051485]|uniref:hypothetical protein n=1 Tax=Dactylosporangium sp. NPDC051485 TaxID=3154846 RepID=UPI00343D01B0